MNLRDGASGVRVTAGANGCHQQQSRDVLRLYSSPHLANAEYRNRLRDVVTSCKAAAALWSLSRGLIRAGGSPASVETRRIGCGAGSVQDKLEAGCRKNRRS